MAVLNSVTLSTAGKRHLIEVEGLRLHVYLDAAGLPTIGVGHLLTKDELSSGKIKLGRSTLDYRKGLTREQCLDMLDADLSVTCATIEKLVRVPLTESQTDALISFVFNVGSRAFQKSTLLKELNKGHYSAIPEQMKRWIYAGGVAVLGLRKRRDAEIALWLTPQTEDVRRA